MFSYFTAAFLVLILPLSLLAYQLAPKRARWIVLLTASYFFFSIVSFGLIVFLIASTLSIYVAGLGMNKLTERRKSDLAQQPENKKEIKARCTRYKKWVLFAAIIFNVGILVALKYLGFFGECAATLLSVVGVEATFVAPQIGIPIGISFYTLMAVSYCVDVYRESIQADIHFGRVALFLSFFPQIMEGPICRYNQTAHALTAGEPLCAQGLYQGSLRVLVGLAKKLIIADRLNTFVGKVFDNYAQYDASLVIAGAVFYTIQLYFDFSGTMDVAIGMGRMFNVTLPENFRQPFFSRTASEFWKRWHITLGSWLKDYVYYPVSLSKPCKAITKKLRRVVNPRFASMVASTIALFCVWTCNGLWHGAGSQYLFFGMYYFVLIVLGGIIEPLWSRVALAHNINREAWWYRALQIARTLVIIVIGEMFFRANGLDAGLGMCAQIVNNFSFENVASGAIFAMGLDRADLFIVSVFVIVFLVIGILKERGANLLNWAWNHKAIVKWLIWAGVFSCFVIFGAYGYGYVAVDPMYAQF